MQAKKTMTNAGPAGGRRRAWSLLPYFQVTPSTVEDVMTVRPAGKS